MAHRPTFFLSSTIYDFRDLRGAIKLSLEARGCRVLASEFNDFGGNLDQHSYDACLTNIEQADYFVLLIGTRVGGWYDKQKRVSITRQEYRTAYELHRQGRIKLVTFVRSEIWQLKEDRAELANFLIDSAVLQDERKTIASAPSKFANDPDFVSGFIAEVGRNLETGRAVATGATKPTGNWIHQFRDFRDINDVLQPLAFTGLTSEDAAYRTALQGELLIIMSSLLENGTTGIVDPRIPLKKGLAAHPITVAIRDSGLLKVDLTAWNEFASVFYSALGTRFETVVVDDALTSTIFMAYDVDKGAYVQSAAYEALSKLWSEIRLFNDLSTSSNLSVLGESTPRMLGRNSGPYDLPADRVALLYSFAHRWINVVSLCESLILHLEGRPFVMPDLMTFSPISGHEDAILAGRVSIVDLRTALGI